MLKFVDQQNGIEEGFLYSKVVPRIGERIIKNGACYKVIDVIYDDDEGDILVKVRSEGYNPVLSIKSVPGDTMEHIHSLIKGSAMLQAVKLLKEVSGAGLREAKDYCDNYKKIYC